MPIHSNPYRTRLGALLLAVATGVPAWAAEPAGQPALDSQVAAFLQQHCVRCHGEQKAENGLRLDRVDADLSRPANFARWQGIVARVRAKEMPPEDEPQPDGAQSTAILRRIAGWLDEAAARQRAEGRTVLRRLNRVEYENTVRDLFAVRVNVKEMLPEDAISHGFDNIGSALNVSPVLMERYLDSADAVLTAATAPLPTDTRKTETYLLQESIPEYFQRAVFPHNGGAVLFRSEGSATQLSRFRPKIPGRFRFRITCQGYQSSTPVAMAILSGNFYTAAGSARYLGYFDAPPGQPGVVEFEARIENPRDTIKIVPADLPRTYLRPENMESYPGPGLWIGPIEIDGPLPEESPAPSYRRVYGAVDPKTATLADAETLLKQFLPRAFRRVTTPDELAPYVALVSQQLEAGQPFDQALRAGYKAVLCSPQFLYLRETTGPLDDFALASRLAYFLWSSTPDVELLQVAHRGQLRDPAVLRAQTERLLSDPKARAFTENFVGQWLSLRDINFTTPDKQLYPEFNDLLQWSMVAETERFFDELLQHDLPVANFIDSDFALLNERLARHYGIAGVEGVAIRKVALQPADHRGGVLTHASVLKVTANGTTTSPVVRGVWVLDRILGQAAAPPPPNVPAIEPDIRGATTIREQLAKHREIASCASCHRQIDPPGFALENYDVIGGWREKYRALGTKNRVQTPPSPIDKFLAKPQYGEGPAVEAGDTLPDGRSFANLAEFKRLLLAQPDQIARTVAQKLMVYATGSGLEYNDQAALDQIVARAEPAHYGLRTLLHEVVQSEMFRRK